MKDFSICSLSESALLIQFGNTISLSLHERVMLTKELLEQNPFAGLIETVPAYNSLAVYYNPLLIEKTENTIAATIEKIITAKLDAPIQSFSPSLAQSFITIPVCYDEAFGIDLKELSQTLQVSIEEIIQLHSSRTYKVFMTGFTPGFPYMGILNEKLVTKRKSQPRLKVEAGAVAIAGNQTGIYPLNTPGGWNIIGKTPLKLFDASKENPFLVKAGDEVKFEVITKDEYLNYAPSDVPVGRENRPAKETQKLNQPFIHIEQCGFLTTIQDGGRNGFLQYGVSKNGVMDLYAMNIANLLVGNEINTSVLEITQSPHRFRMLTNSLVAFGGGGLQPEINGKEIPLFQTVYLEKDAVVELKKQTNGFRLYMAVAGGFAGDAFLESQSTDLLAKAGGLQGRGLRKDDTIHQLVSLSSLQKNLLNILQNQTTIELKTNADYVQLKTIRVMKGVEWDNLTNDSKAAITSSALTISAQSNRMGYRLKSDRLLTAHSYDIISSPVTQGTVQLTSSGELIVLTADAQTVGGYPRILQVIAADLPAMAQKKPGDAIQFEMVSLREAEELLMKQNHQLEKIKELIQSVS
jgi:KipI family sensor histidine kinase inhibitor